MDFSVSLIELVSLVISLIAGTVSWFSIDKSLRLERLNDLYRHELKVQESELQIKLEAMHSGRIEGIRKLYASLLEVREHYMDLVSMFETSGMGSKEERLKSLIQSHRNLINIWRENILFLTSETENRIDRNFLQELRKNVTSFQMFVMNEEYQFTDKGGEVWQAADEFGRIGIVNTLKEIATEFREVIGVEQKYKEAG